MKYTFIRTNEPDVSFIKHYGVLGMKWGVRKNRNVISLLKKKVNKKHAQLTRRKVDKIIGSMHGRDKNRVLAGSDHYLDKNETKTVAKRIMGKRRGKSVGFFDVFEPQSNGTVNIALGVKNDKKLRGKGIGSKMTKKALEWMAKNPEFKNKTVVWGVRTDNKASIAIAKKYGFKLDDDSYSDDGKWVNYTKKIKPSK